MKTFLLTICFLSVQTGMVAIAQDKEQTPVYLDDTQPIEVRVQDALNRMTVEEKTRLSYAQPDLIIPHECLFVDPMQSGKLADGKQLRFFPQHFQKPS